jgi:hypothetical protein
LAVSVEDVSNTPYASISAMKPNMIEVSSQRRMGCRKKDCSFGR